MARPTPLTPTNTTPTHMTLRLLKLPTRSALGAAHGVRIETFRLLTIIEAHLDNDLGTSAGWGECSALNEPGYTAEWAEGAFEMLRSGNEFDVVDQPMAAAAVEMALLDIELKQAGETLAERLGTAGGSSTAGGVVGLGPLPAMLDEVEQLVGQGYHRIKLKIAPGKIVVPVEAVRTSFPDIELQVDANGSLRSEDLPALVHLRDLGVRAIEQPFDVTDRASAARLVAETDLTVVADEAVTSAHDVDEIGIDRTATAISVKPSKLGGIAAALKVIDHVVAAGMNASIGGMLESGLGRHVLAAMAPLPAFTVTGDLSPAKRWLAEDPFRDIAMKRGEILAPERPGIAGDPVRTRLDRYTVRKAIVPATNALTSIDRTV